MGPHYFVARRSKQVDVTIRNCIDFSSSLHLQQIYSGITRVDCRTPA